MALVEELPYRPFEERGQLADGVFRWRLGVRPLDLANWFEFGTDGAAWVAEKPEIIAAHRDTVFATLDDVDAECREVADAISVHLGHDLDPTLHPLDAAARLVPDDLVVMVEREGRLVFGAGSVCFPNRWDLRSKLGRTMTDVHAPVAGLNEQLGSAVDSFLERLAPDRSFWRLGWGLIDSPNGFEPPRESCPVDAAAIASGIPRDDVDVHMRVEREALRRFPDTRCVLFTIRTYLAPITSLDAASRLRVSSIVAAMSEPVQRYKDVTSSASSSNDTL